MTDSKQAAAKNLSTLALFIWLDVRQAMTAAFLTHVAGVWFHKQQAKFHMNPANTLPYQALKSLEEQSVVRLVEVLSDKDKIHPHDAPIRRLEDLGMHRDAISHPLLVGWRKRMAPFMEADRDAYDWRPALVWDLHRSINEHLRAHGLPTGHEAILATPEMAATLHLVLSLSWKPDVELPPVEALLVWLKDQAPKYQAELEKHPDGMRDPAAEMARVERKRARRARWAARAKATP